MTECLLLEDERSHHFDEDDPITFLFNESEVALSYQRDAGLNEAGRVWSLIECQKKTTTTDRKTDHMVAKWMQSHLLAYVGDIKFWFSE